MKARQGQLSLAGCFFMADDQVQHNYHSPCSFFRQLAISCTFHCSTLYCPVTLYLILIFFTASEGWLARVIAIPPFPKVPLSYLPA